MTNGLGPCLLCVVSPAVCLHEITPKSLDPKGWDTPENQAPLCNRCHMKVQADTPRFRPILHHFKRERAYLYSSAQVKPVYLELRNTLI